jgi:hypothetical protein
MQETNPSAFANTETAQTLNPHSPSSEQFQYEPHHPRTVNRLQKKGVC